MVHLMVLVVRLLGAGRRGVRSACAFTWRVACVVVCGRRRGRVAHLRKCRFCSRERRREGKRL